MVCARAFSATAGVAERALFPHSDLVYRALLRNLRLLTGMREKERFHVLLAGYEAAHAARRLAALEPALVVDVVGGAEGVSAGLLAPFRGKDCDAAIVLQPYHVLRRGGGELSALRACLDSETGALGMVWTRPAPAQAGWVGSFTAAAGGAGLDLGAARGLVPPMPPGSDPMAWVDSLPLGGTGFKAMKHRKFVEALGGPPATYLPLLRCIHDARFEPAGKEEGAFTAGAGAALSCPPGGDLKLDMHGFTTTVSTAPGVKAAGRKDAKMGA